MSWNNNKKKYSELIERQREDRNTFFELRTLFIGRYSCYLLTSCYYFFHSFIPSQVMICMDYHHQAQQQKIYERIRFEHWHAHNNYHHVEYDYSLQRSQTLFCHNRKFTSNQIKCKNHRVNIAISNYSLHEFCVSSEMRAPIQLCVCLSMCMSHCRNLTLISLTHIHIRAFTLLYLCKSNLIFHFLLSLIPFSVSLALSYLK